MAHDPLCPGPQYGDLVPAGHQDQAVNLFCRCDLIAAVRADNDREWLNNRGKSMVYAAALRDAVEAAREKHFAVMEHGKQPCSVHGCDGCHLSSYLGEVVAAIEALLDTARQQANEHINLGGYDPQASDNRP